VLVLDPQTAGALPGRRLRRGPRALDCSIRAEGLLWATPALLEAAEFEFYAALAHAAACDSASADERRRHLDAVASHHGRLELWARHCPDNWENRAVLVAAEAARLEGRDGDAMRLYEQAIRSALDNGFVHNGALAAELAARFYAGRGVDRIARDYLRDARRGYLQWGADGKARQLEERYPYLRDEDPRPDPVRTTRTPVEHLDLETVLKFLQVMSGAADLETLAASVMRLALEHAGAERGLLILAEGDAFRIGAEAGVSGDGVSVALRQSAPTHGKLPESVLHYVFRTREPAILHDASAENPFSGDEYLRRHRVRSLLCMPLLKQSRLVGVIYLENNLAPGVFDPARMAVLKLLASAAAISLENARLYRDLQEREARVRRLVESNIVGIVSWHADGRILEANDEFLRIVGYDREDLDSGRMRWTDLTPAEWHDRDDQALAEIREGGAVQAHERDYLKKDGSRVPVLAAGAVFDAAPDEGVAFVLDLTEQRRAEQAQRESERESRLIVDTIPGMVALLSPTGWVEVVNHQLLDFFGQTLEELRDWGTNGTVHPEDMPHVADVFTRAIGAGSPYIIVQRFRRSDGVYRWFENRGFPLRDTAGRITRWCVLLTDIDEQKRAEEALAASERNLQLIIDTIPAMVWSALPDGTADFFNQHYLEFVGLTTEEAAGWGWTVALHPDDMDGLAGVWMHSMATGEPGEAEARMRRHDGEYSWFLFRTSPLRDEGGGIVKWYGVNTNIEDRKRAEGELRRAYDSFADAQRLSHTGSFVTDLVGDDHTWSEETYRIFEFEPGTKVTVQRVRDIVHPDDLPSFDSMIARGISGADVGFSFRLLTARAAVKHIRGVAHVVEQVQGRPMFVGALQDVTETVVAEEALDRARSELAHVARVATMSALTASIAHEVNQPLSGIITNASTCLRMLDADPPDLAGARETARRTIRDGNRASDVINRLRTLFSRREFTLEPVDLNEAIQEVVALSSGDLQRSRVILQPELADDLPSVIGDRVQLQQVVLNLLLNAVDAMSRVDDRPRFLLIRTEREDGDHARVTVRDSGTGVGFQDMDKCFNAFYTTKAGGMGVGLSVSRSIVERHRGRIWAEANEGPGTTFIFSIPCRPGSSADAPRS
jgi:PAS domain S-box-containing protein